MSKREGPQSGEWSRSVSRGETDALHEYLAAPEETSGYGRKWSAKDEPAPSVMPQVGTQFLAASTSTRWTRGRGNKSLPRRLAGAAAGVLIAPFVMCGRAFIYGLGGAAEGVRGGAAWATSILKNMHPIPRVICALPLLLIGLGGGAVGGAVYGAVRGFFGAIPDIGRGIISELSGGDANYFALANRKYRD